MSQDTAAKLPPEAAEELDAALREFIESRKLPLYHMMSFQLGWKDEIGERAQPGPPPRVHGSFTLASAHAVGGDYRRAIDYAISVELINGFWLIHTDIEDGNTERAGRPSVWWTWGPAQAINTGDGMHAMARLALFRLTEKGVEPHRVAAAIRGLDEATVRICEGEYLDIANQDRLLMATSAYLEMAESRVGALFGCAARFGALAAGDADDRLALSLEAFGTKVGTARQLASDYDTLWPQGNRDQVQQGRMIAKKKNLPVVHTFESADPATKRRLGEIYMQRVLDPKSLDEVAHLCEAAGGREAAAAAIHRLVEESQENLERSGLGQAGRSLLREEGRALVRPHS